jgi:hypothetical protein
MSKIRKDSLDSIWLTAFLAVAEHHTFAGAGRALGCHATQVGRYITDLEEWFDTILFDRKNKMILTRAGKHYLPLLQIAAKNVEKGSFNGELIVSDGTWTHNLLGRIACRHEENVRSAMA